MARLEFDVTIRGVALANYGLTEWDTVDGFALMTHGFVYGCPNIWYGPYTSIGTTSITTGWTLSANATLSTTWALVAGATVSTTWTDFSTYNIEDC